MMMMLFRVPYDAPVTSLVFATHLPRITLPSFICFPKLRPTENRENSLKFHAYQRAEPLTYNQLCVRAAKSPTRA